MKIVKILSSSVGKLNRLLIKVRRMGREDIQVGYSATPFGIDSNPIDGMVGIFHDTVKKGDNVLVGYIQPNMLAAKGETRLFSLDANGNLKTYLWLKADGTMELGGNANHLARFEQLQTAFNALKSDYNAHKHTGVQTGGGVSGITDTISSADISSAKAPNILTA